MFMSIVNTEHSLKLSVLEFYIIRAGRYIENVMQFTQDLRNDLIIYIQYTIHT